ncbi:efflux RND transporter periplasmic adaptor subunit [Parvularcula marina]|nr:efflux RND transporter periplasmic adaptor subunit [Parvularcula marina]
MSNKICQMILLGCICLMLLSGCGETESTASEMPKVVNATEDHAHEDEKSDDTHDDQHGEDHGEEGVELEASAADALGVRVRTASLSSSEGVLQLPAEIRHDADRVANIAAPIAGIVKSVTKSEGAHVTEGEELAVISSRELADLKAEFISAKSAEALARAELKREENLFADKITSEADLLAARAAFSRSQAAREAAETKLHAIGLDHDVIDRLDRAEDGELSLFRLTSPLAGQVVRRDLTLGQSVDVGTEQPLFVVADTSVVWADLAVYKSDLAILSEGALVTFQNDNREQLAQGRVSFISPLIDETSRTATARVVLANTDGMLRPGQFLTALVERGTDREAVLIPEDAVQSVEGQMAVFVPSDHGFALQPVRTGERLNGQIEIVSGLEAGQPYVAEGAFTLKAELEKAAFGDGHNH